MGLCSIWWHRCTHVHTQRENPLRTHQNNLFTEASKIKRMSHQTQRTPNQEKAICFVHNCDWNVWKQRYCDILKHHTICFPSYWWNMRREFGWGLIFTHQLKVSHTTAQTLCKKIFFKCKLFLQMWPVQFVVMLGWVIYGGPEGQNTTTKE